MLEEVIEARSNARDHNRRIALSVQRIAWAVAIPSSVLMVVGLVSLVLRGDRRGQLLGQSVVPFEGLLSRAALSPVGAMSLGLIALSLLPMVNVLYIFADSLIHRRWTDAVAAAAVAAILSVGLFLGRA